MESAIYFFAINPQARLSSSFNVVWGLSVEQQPQAARRQAAVRSACGLRGLVPHASRMPCC